MRLDYIDPFVESAVGILSTYTGMPVERGMMELRRGFTESNDVAAVIGLAGEVEGRVVLDMDKDTALAIAGIMNQEPFNELSALALDTLTELANLVVAKAVTVLNDKGFTFRLTPPLILMGNNISIANLNLETLVIPLCASAGEMNLSVALRMKTL